jgi:tetratricopeptide (TPR) repeat protein
MPRSIGTSLAGWGLLLGAIATGPSIAQAMPPESPKPPVLINCDPLPPEPSTVKTQLPDQAELLGDYRLCANDPTAAIGFYQTAVAGYQALGEDATTQTTIALFKLARAHLTAQQDASALDFYRQAIARDPIYGFLPVFADRQVSPLGEPVTDFGLRGDANAGPLRAESSITASAYFEMAYDLDRLGSPLSAIPAYRKAILLQPRFAHAHLGLGVALQKSMDYDAALKAYQTALNLQPDLVWGHYHLGAFLTSRYRPQEAMVELRKVVDAHTGLDTLGEPDKQAIVYDLMGDLYQARGDSPSADRAYQQALALSPQGPAFYLKLGQNYLAWGQHQRAIDSFRQALAQLPVDAVERETAELGIAEGLVWSGRWPEAIAQLESVLKRWPNSADAQKLREYVNSRPR